IVGCRQILIFHLAVTMVNTETRSQHSPAMKDFRRPGKADARIKIGLSGLRKFGAGLAESATRRKVKRNRSSVGFVENIEELITQSEIERKRRCDFVFVL